MAEETRNRHLYRSEYNKKGDMPGQVILEKHNGYKEALKKESIGDGNGHSSEMIPLALRSAAMAVITNEVGRPWKELEKTGVRGSLRIIGNIMQSVWL